jgi:hypothetical protein
MLVAAADTATSHPYCALVDKVGQIETTGSDSAVSRLADVCRLRAVDQENVSDPDILSLTDRVLAQPDDEVEVIAVVKA